MGRREGAAAGEGHSGRSQTCWTQSQSCLLSDPGLAPGESPRFSVSSAISPVLGLNPACQASTLPLNYNPSRLSFLFLVPEIALRGA